MSCPDCARAATRDTGIADATCLDCCVRALESLRKYGRKAQEARMQAWERMPGYVGTDLVLQALKSRAALRAMAPMEEGA